MKPPIKKKTGLLKYQAGGNPYSNWSTPGYNNYMKSGMMNLDRKGNTTAGSGDAGGGGVTAGNVTAGLSALGSVGSAFAQLQPDPYAQYKAGYSNTANSLGSAAQGIASATPAGPFIAAGTGIKAGFHAGRDAGRESGNLAGSEAGAFFGGFASPSSSYIDIANDWENDVLTTEQAVGGMALNIGTMGLGDAALERYRQRHYEMQAAKNAKSTNVGSTRIGDYTTQRGNLMELPIGQTGGRYQTGGYALPKYQNGIPEMSPEEALFEMMKRQKETGSSSIPAAFQNYVPSPGDERRHERVVKRNERYQNREEKRSATPVSAGYPKTKGGSYRNVRFLQNGGEGGPNAELEGGEVIERAQGRDKHIPKSAPPHEEGGTDETLGRGDFVWSDHLKYNGRSFADWYKSLKEANISDSEKALAIEELRGMQEQQAGRVGTPPVNEEGMLLAQTGIPKGWGDRAWNWFDNKMEENIYDPARGAKEYIVNTTNNTIDAGTNTVNQINEDAKNTIFPLTSDQKKAKQRAASAMTPQQQIAAKQAEMAAIQIKLDRVNAALATKPQSVVRQKAPAVIPTPVSVDPRVNAQGPTREDMYALLGQEEASKFRTDEILRDYHAQNTAAYNTKNGLGPDAGAKALAEAKANPDYFKNQPANTKTDNDAKRSKTGEFINRYGHYAGLALGPLGAIIGASLQKPFDYDVPAPPNFGRSPVHLSRAETDLTAERAAASKAMDTLKRAGKSVNLNSDLNTVQRGLAEMASKEKGRVDQLNLGQAGNEAEMNQRDAQFVQQLTAEYGDRYATRRIEKEAANTMFKNQRVADVVGAIGEAGKMGTYYAAQERAADAYRGPETGLTDRTYGYKYNFENWKKANPKGTQQEWIAWMAAEMNKA